MTSLCHVCEHPRRAEIELAVARKVPLRVISRKFGPSIFSVHRHGKNHMPPQLMAALVMTGTPTVIDLEALKISESEGLLQTLVVQRGRLYSLLNLAEEAGDFRAAASIHGRIIDNLNTTAKLLGEVQTHAQTVINNLTVSQDYLELRSSLVRALRPHPEALKALHAVLRGVEGAEPHTTGIPKVIDG